MPASNEIYDQPGDIWWDEDQPLSVIRTALNSPRRHSTCRAAPMAGSVLHAMFIGVMAKWFMDPGQALTAHELARGLQIIAQHMKGKDL